MQTRLTLVTLSLLLSMAVSLVLQQQASAMLLGTILDQDGDDSTLVEIDPETGSLLRTIGLVGYEVNGLEFNPRDRILYATTSTNDPVFPDGLIEIDMTTGAGTPIGLAGRMVNNPTSSGRFDTMYGWTEDGDDLVSIDRTTGVATVIGDSGVSTSQHGLAFDASGTLFLVNRSDGDVYTVNRSTGVATSVGTLNQRAHHGDFDNSTGYYFGLDDTVDNTATRQLVVASLSTTSVTVQDLIPTVDNLHTLSFIPERPPITAIAGTLYGTTFNGGVTRLVELSPGTGDLIDTIGVVGYQVNGLEYNASDDRLYATTSTNDPTFPDGLIEIDMSTGEGTPIGLAGRLVNNPTANSTGQMYAWTEQGDDLVTIDTSTGVATVVGDSGVSTEKHGLAFDTGDFLFLINGGGEVYTIDTSTGVGTMSGDLYATSHHGDFDPATGLYFGIDITPPSTNPKQLIVSRITTTSARIVTRLDTVDYLHTITFRPYPAPETKTAYRLLGTTLDTKGENSTLVEIDPYNGDLVRTIGLVGYMVNGLEYNQKEGRLYGTTSFNDPNFPDGLIRINLATGEGTPIGTGAGMLINNPTVNSSGQMYAWTEDDDDAVTVDTATGTATVVGDSGVSSSQHGLAFDTNDNLFLVNRSDGDVYIIFTLIGSGTMIGSLGQRAHHGDFDPQTGLYFGLDTLPSDDNNFGNSARRIIIAEITPTGARAVAVTPTIDDLFTLTFYKKSFNWVMFNAAITGGSPTTP